MLGQKKIIGGSLYPVRLRPNLFGEFFQIHFFVPINMLVLSIQINLLNQ